VRWGGVGKMGGKGGKWGEMGGKGGGGIHYWSDMVIETYIIYTL